MIDGQLHHISIFRIKQEDKRRKAEEYFQNLDINDDNINLTTEDAAKSSFKIGILVITGVRERINPGYLTRQMASIHRQTKVSSKWLTN